jgi:enamine deaminase RidA (YjgF/YER057c/UK114 family)
MAARFISPGLWRRRPSANPSRNRPPISLAQIDATLKQAGTDKTKILKANIWLTDIGTWAQMNEAWDAWVVAGQTPARATVESKLAGPGLDVEIMVEAAI